MTVKILRRVRSERHTLPDHVVDQMDRESTEAFRKYEAAEREIDRITSGQHCYLDGDEREVEIAEAELQAAIMTRDAAYARALAHGKSRREPAGVMYYAPARAVLTPEEGRMNQTELMELCEQVMGSHELAEQWMSRPAMGLNYERPVDLIETQTGRDRVQTLLLQIEGGVYI